MAYNYFPASYQPMMYQNPMGQQQQQPLQQPQLSQPVQNTNIVWVSGETGAKSYLLAPNTTLPLWDSERQTIYLKTTDASGMPTMKILDYTIRDTTAGHTPIAEAPSDFVTHDELNDFENRITKTIEELKEARNESHANNSNGNTAKKQSNGSVK